MPFVKIQAHNHIKLSPTSAACFLENLVLIWFSSSMSGVFSFYKDIVDIVVLLVIPEWNSYLRHRMISSFLLDTIWFHLKDISLCFSQFFCENINYFVWFYSFKKKILSSAKTRSLILWLTFLRKSCVVSHF